MDAASLFWLAGSIGAHAPVVRKMAKTGGAPSTLCASPAYPADIALDDDYVYWSSAGGDQQTTKLGSILRAAKATGEVQMLESGLTGVIPITLLGGEVWWVDQIDQTKACGYSINKAASSGGPTTVVATGECGVSGIAALGSRVYWACNSPGGDIIRSVDAAGGTVSTDATDPAEGATTVSNDLETGHIYAWQPAGPPPTALVASAMTFPDVHVGKSLLIWSDAGSGNSMNPPGLYDAPLAGVSQPRQTLLADPDVSAVTIDDTTVYWTDYPQGSPAPGSVHSMPLP
jgi:hypothetical protein